MSGIVSDLKSPLYIQLREIIEKEITQGVYKKGEQIPPENELCKKYGVSKITVRQAIDGLVQNKLLYKIQGKGTFIRENKIKRFLPKLYSFSEDMRELGLSPSSRVLYKKVEEADEKVKTTLKLPNNDSRINKLVRVRLANGKPILIEKTVVPHYLCPELLKNDLAKDSLYRILVEDFEFMLEWAEESYEASMIEAGEAKELQCEDDQPVFRISRITYLKTGEPIELTHSVARGDRMHFSLQLVTDNIPLRRHVTF